MKNQSETVFLSWLAGVLVMAEEVEESSAVTGRRQPVEGDKHADTIKSEIIQLR